MSVLRRRRRETSIFRYVGDAFVWRVRERERERERENREHNVCFCLF